MQNDKQKNLVVPPEEQFYRNMVRFQMVLFLLIFLFWVALGFRWVMIPAGAEGVWFDKIWNIILLVASPSALAGVMGRAAQYFTGKADDDEKNSTGTSSTPAS